MRVLAVEPEDGPDELPTELRIHGEGFTRGVRTNFADPSATTVDDAAIVRLDDVDLPGARIVSPRLVTAHVPAGLARGRYAVVVIDASRRESRLRDAFEVRVAACTDATRSAPGDCEACAAVDGCTCDPEGACAPTCGDGVRRSPEGCDDGALEDGDGCSAGCEVEPGYTCSGRPSACSEVCGDGVRTSGEPCDDANSTSGDGCSASCAVEPGYQCHGELGARSDCGAECGDGAIGPGEGCDDGNATAGDGCDADCAMEAGFLCAAPGLECAPICGDGLVLGGEGCDDQNRDNLDGCSAACATEAGFLCTTAGAACAPICGDALLVAGEGCDDGDLTAGDGCSAECDAEPGYRCEGAGPCASICGDALVVASETCDDGGILAGDGCSAACAVELGFTCPTEGAPCVPTCGDGLVVGVEGCDDGGAGGGDGCSASCTIEPGFRCPAAGAACETVCGDTIVAGLESCDDGNPTGADGCSETCGAELGFTCPPAGGACVTTCGDALIVGAETCDDGDGEGGDGCSAACTLERGWTCAAVGQSCSVTCGDAIRAGPEECDDGDLEGADGCSTGCTLELGFTCLVEGTPCTAICGDALIRAGETCDDGNLTVADGCSNTCLLERGFTCPTPGTTCVTTCGDGIRAGLEQCDDGDTQSTDGCSAACVLEQGYTCVVEAQPCAAICGDGLIRGLETCDDGDAVAGDGCGSSCTVELGYTCPAPGAACAAICGDGLVRGAEGCDDGDALGGDGCSAACVVETGYTCPTPGAACATVCGDALRAGTEACDDGGVASGDGCSATCTLEPGFTCATPGAPCTAVCGDGLVRGAELCDDGNLVSFDGCDGDCRPTCGNGLVNAGEACDDGNYLDGDTCEADCTLPACGNAILDLTEVCDDGDLLDGDGCDSNCTLTACGNGVATAGEECDDGDLDDEDGCRADCARTSANSALFADGAEREWAPVPATDFHFTNVGPACSGTTWVEATVLGARESFQMALTAVPIGAVITDLEVTACASSVTGAAAQLQLYTIVNGVNGSLGGALAVAGTTQTTLPTYTFSGLDLPRGPTTTLGIGLSLSGGTGGIRVSSLAFRILYHVRPFPAPTALTAVHAGGGDVDLTWVDASSFETRFTVERSVGDDQAWTPATSRTAGTTTARDGFLPEDQTYYYRVRAEDEVTTLVSPWSETARVVTATGAPRAPRNMGALADGLGGVTVLWTDASRAEDGFTLERRTDGGPFSEVATLDPNTTSYLDLCSATDCSYRIRAFNALGASAWSNIGSTTTGPGTDVDLELTFSASGSSQIGLQLTTVTIGYDNSGTNAAEGVEVAVTIPPQSTYNLGASTPGWRCHARASDYERLVLTIGRVLRGLRSTFPNLAQVLLSSTYYQGYAAPGSELMEPFSYEAAYAISRIVAAQLAQARGGEPDALAGDLDHVSGRVPWTTWGPYLWANGPFSNGLGFNFALADYNADHITLGPTGLFRTTYAHSTYLYGSSWTPWFRVVSGPPVSYVVPGNLPDQRPAVIDMIPGLTYAGLPGRLYEGPSNTIPSDHEAAGIAAATGIVQRGTDGAPSPTGRIVFLGIGHAGSEDVMDDVITTLAPDPRTAPSTTLVMVNGAVAGGWASAWAELDNPVYDTLLARLGGLDPRQVQAIWFNPADLANTTNAVPLEATGGGTRCTFPLGQVPAGASGSLAFAVSTTFQRSTALIFPISVADDGTGGTDGDPFDNSGELSFAPSICHLPGGPGCDRCIGVTCGPDETCDPRIGCVPNPP